MAAEAWLILRAGYKKVKPADLSLVFLIVDLLVWILAIYRPGADQSLLFFLSVVRVSDQAFRAAAIREVRIRERATSSTSPDRTR